MASTSNQEAVQYIQLLNNSEIISVDSNDAETQQIITIDEDEPDNQSTIVDNLQIQDIQYLETEEISENDILIIHNDKQYIIPKKQLSEAENTIILETNDNNYQQEQQLDDNTMYYSENEISATQYVVLKDGKLHFDTDDKEIEEKLKDFQTSITDFHGEVEEIDEEMKEELEQITGKNLLTGQTISLSGFMDKIRQKGFEDVSAASISRRSVFASPKLGCGNDYVLIPPVNKKVVVGRTTDGKKLVGRVLQIQKKINTLAQAPAHRTQRRPLQQQKPRSSKRLQPDSDPPDLPPDITYTPLTDNNISRTLSGLMDLESVSRSLINHLLIVKHAQRRSLAGKPVPGTRQVKYYLGRMVKGEATAWNFQNVEPRRPQETSFGIDLLESGSEDRQTLKVKIGEDGEFGSQQGMKEVRGDDGEPPVQLFLTVTVDEFNKKKTKLLSVTVSRLHADTSNYIIFCVRLPMVKGEATAWNFQNIEPKRPQETSFGIDLLESGSEDRQTLKVKIGDDGEFGSQQGMKEVRGDDGEPPVQLFLTVTVDEFNKKKTKVSIPQLAQNNNKPRTTDPKHDQKPSDAHICQICGKKFQTLTSLRRHLTVHDPLSRPLQCVQCSARFTDESSLKKHLILHSGLKPYSCEVCGKAFSHKSDLNFHMKIHNSEKKFKCQVCLKSFHRHSNLLRHEEIHRSVAMETANGSGEGAGCHDDEEHKQPPYCCEVCGVQYNFISSLTRHIVTHHINGDGNDT